MIFKFTKQNQLKRFHWKEYVKISSLAMDDSWKVKYDKKIKMWRLIKW